MKKAVILLMILTLLSEIIGFFRDIILAYFYGTSEVSDIYLIALTIPVVIFGVVARGISTGYIPMYSRIEENEGEQEALRYTNNLINVLLLFSTVIILLGLLFTEPLVRLFASGFEGKTLETAVLFTRITLLGIYFTVFVRILSAYLNYQKLFSVPNLLGIPMSLIIIGSIILSYSLNRPILLAFGLVFALFTQWLILLFFSMRKSFRYKPIFDLKDKNLRRLLVLAVPVILGSTVTQINKLVDRTLASQITVGGISALNYAHTLTNFVQGVFVTSIVTVMFPSISKMASKGNKKQMSYTMHLSIIGVLLLTIPATVGSLLFAEPIVQLLFGRGAFDATAAAMTSGAFFFYAIGMSGTGLRVVLSQAFYSLQDTKTPMVNAALAMGLNIVLNFSLAPFMGLRGLALATSISAIFCALLLLINLRKKMPYLQYTKIGKAFLKISFASAVMGGLAFYFYQFFLHYMTTHASLLLTIFFAVVLYLFIISLLKIEAADNLISALKKRIPSSS